MSAIVKPPMEIAHTAVNVYVPPDHPLAARFPTWRGRSALPLRAIVVHVMAGYYRSSINWFHDAANEVSANYCIAKDGRIAEVVDPFGPFAPWANGIPVDDHTGRRLVELATMPPPLADLATQQGPNANWVTCSIECEGFPTDADFPTAAQYRSLVALIAWVCLQAGLTPDATTVLPHTAFNTRDKPNCPGPHMDFGYLTRETARALARRNDAAAPLVFPTGYTIGGGFRAFWQQHGGTLVLGYPLSDEQTEIVDGTPRTVQYFERYKLVYFPEHVSPWDVQGADLGRQALAATGKA